MKDQYESRMRAYRYIVEQARKVNPGLSYESAKTLADVPYISLDDLVRLKEGRDNPSPELVVALKRLLHPVASEADIDDYPVKPFLPETCSHPDCKNSQSVRESSCP